MSKPDPAPPVRGSARPVLPTVRLLGVPITRIDASGACGHILDSLAQGVGGWVVTPNLDILRRLVKEPEFRAECDEVDLMLADGMPLVWASRVQGTSLPERVAGSDLIWRLAEAAAGAGRSIYLLGGNPGSAEAATRVLQERWPALRVAGVCCPPFGFEHDAAYLDGLDRMLAAASPDVVFVGLGSPKQERLIRRLRSVLPGAWFLGVGVTFSFAAGEIRRAPRWMQRAGLEWCHRLFMEPGRLWRRYLVHGIPFAVRLLGSALINRRRRTAERSEGIAA